MKLCRKSNDGRNKEPFPRAMSCTVRALLPIGLLLVTADRLPAPIQEVPESPTPAPEQSARPKPKRIIKPKASESSENSTKAKTSSPPQTKAAPQHNLFDGTWVGKTCVGFDGSHETMDVTIFISAGGTRVDVKMVGVGFASQEGGVGEKVYTSKKPICDGRTVKWNDGWGNWVLTPNSDGKTAHFTCDWSPGLLLLPACHSSETFQKVSP
jgi:hypothetical protein